MFSITDNP